MDIRLSESPKGTKAVRLSEEDFQIIKGFIQEEISNRVAMEPARVQASKLPTFSNDDASFLIWMAGFTAGANLERDGERGERIFARCRDIRDKLFARGGNAS